MHYFDHNATSPLLPVARDAWLAAADSVIGNPSSLHRIGQRADHALEAAGESFARALGCSSQNLIWTSGATESANTLLHHLADINKGDQPLWVSAIEHPCVLEAARRYFGARVVHVPVLPSGVVDIDWMDRHIRQDPPVALVMMAANHETGVIQPWSVARKLCREHGVLFACDATQWVGRRPAFGLGECDYVFASAHKSGGPKGVGFLKCAVNTPLSPLLHGGAQQGRRRAGTENVPAIISWEAALNWCEAQLAENQDNVRLGWRNEFAKSIENQIDDARVNGRNEECLWNTVSISLPVTDCRQMWTVKLDRSGFAVSSGSACSSGNEKPSHVLLAMGHDEERIRRTVRISAGWRTTQDQWSALANAIFGVWKTWRHEVPQNNSVPSAG